MKKLGVLLLMMTAAMVMASEATETASTKAAKKSEIHFFKTTVAVLETGVARIWGAQDEDIRATKSQKYRLNKQTEMLNDKISRQLEQQIADLMGKRLEQERFLDGF